MESIVLNLFFVALAMVGLTSLISVGVIGLYQSHREFKATLLSFFGKRGPYDNFRSFLSEYKAKIAEGATLEQRQVVRVWRTFLDDIKVVKHRKGRFKFETTDHALDRLERELLKTVDSLNPYARVNSQLVVAVGCAFGMIFALAGIAAIVQSPTLLAFQTQGLFGLGSSVACVTIGFLGFICLREFQNWVREKAKNKVDIVCAHLRRHMLMRTESHYLFEINNAIAEELKNLEVLASTISNLRPNAVEDLIPVLNEQQRHANQLSEGIMLELSRQRAEFNSAQEQNAALLNSIHGTLKEQARYQRFDAKAVADMREMMAAPTPAPEPPMANVVKMPKVELPRPGAKHALQLISSVNRLCNVTQRGHAIICEQRDYFEKTIRKSQAIANKLKDRNEKARFLAEFDRIREQVRLFKDLDNVDIPQIVAKLSRLESELKKLREPNAMVDGIWLKSRVANELVVSVGALRSMMKKVVRTFLYNQADMLNLCSALNAAVEHPHTAKPSLELAIRLSRRVSRRLAEKVELGAGFDEVMPTLRKIEVMGGESLRVLETNKGNFEPEYSIAS